MTVIAIHAESWKSDRSESQWRASMRDYVLPHLARKRVDAVMKWAVAQGYRDDNPAGDAIAAALPKTAVRQQHMRALPHAEVGAAELFDGQGLVFPSPTGRVLNHATMTK